MAIMAMNVALLALGCGAARWQSPELSLDNETPVGTTFRGLVVLGDATTLRLDERRTRDRVGRGLKTRSKH